MILTTAPPGRVARIPLGTSMTSQARLSVIGSLAPIYRTPLVAVLSPHSVWAGYSVDTVPCLPSSEACNVCQARVAHLTRTGNLETPEKTASLPSSARVPFAGDWPVTSLWNWSKSLAASALVLPFTLCVIMDAEAVEIAHPEPWKLMSRIESPSKSRYTVKWSPQSGLYPSALWFAVASS